MAGWVSAIGALAGTALSFLGSKSSAEDSSALQYQYQTKLNKQNYDYNVKLINLQNAFNEAMMDKANIYNTESWEKSAQMANTAHQREVSDLRAAGLNPILSANGGASVVNPIQSAQASSGNSQLSSQAGMPHIDYVKDLSTASSIYQENRRVNNELSNSRTAREFQRSQTANTYNQMRINEANSASQIAKQNAEIKQIENNIKNQNALTSAQIANYTAQTHNYMSNSAKTAQETKNLAYQSAEYQRHNQFLKNQTKVGRTIYNWAKAFNLSTSAKVR